MLQLLWLHKETVETVKKSYKVIPWAEKDMPHARWKYMHVFFRALSL